MIAVAPSSENEGLCPRLHEIRDAADGLLAAS